MQSEIVILFLSLALVQCRPLSRDQITTSFNDCANAAQMDPQTIRDSLKNEVFLQPSTSYYKFLECHYKNQNFLNSEGNVDYKVIKESTSRLLKASFAAKLVKPCENVQNGSSQGERAYNAAKCMFNQYIEMKSELKN